MRLPYRFGRYILTKKLAIGGMAEIYSAKYLGESGFEKRVAIKRLLPTWSADRDFIAMLIDEARALVHLQHQNIVQVFELGKEEESFFISMELVDGLDLGCLSKKLVQEKNFLPLKYSLYLICQTLQGLDFAHRQTGPDGKSLNIVHRDVSPPNVLLSWNGEVKVADFGIAKGAHRTYETTVTQVKGKYSYMSPEQAMGQVVDQRTDIYAAGILLYELLTCQRLFDAPNDLEVIELVKSSEIPMEPLKKIDLKLKEILLTALKKDREERYQTAGDFLTAVNNYALKHSLVTTGPEFGKFLQEAFPKTKLEGEIEPIITSLKPKTKQFGKITQWKIRIGGRRFFVRSAATASLVLCATLPWAPPIATISPTPLDLQEAVEKEAILNINAQPWGYVTVPGYVSKMETPIRNLKVKSGTQLVKIYYEPKNQWVTANVDARSDAATTCYAKFGDSPMIKCK